MGRSVGIDLGTTNSVVAIADGDGAEVLLNQASERRTRSVIGLHRKSGQLLLGGHAVDYAPANSENTIFSIKRLIGRFWDDPEVQKARARYAYRIVPASDGSADVRVMLGDREMTPTEVSGIILRKLKEDAEKRLNDTVSHAVITVPAYFSNLQRICTRRAGELAGLRVKAVVDEPTAAAIAFGLSSRSAQGETVFVFDLGGGTFDVSILFMVGESSFSPLNIEGDMWLGGDDFDHRIVDFALGEIDRRYRIDPSRNCRFMVLLKKAAEKAKVELSEMPQTTIMLLSAVPGQGGEMLDLELELTREKFEDLIRDRAVDETMAIARRALEGASLSPEQIDRVLLVGGSTSIPLVQSALARMFGGEKIMRNIDPMSSVALGAAILADRLEGQVCPRKECQAFNTLEARVCRGPDCGIVLWEELAGVRRPIGVRRCNGCAAENPPSAEICAGCGKALKRIEAGGITAKAIGIETRDDGYEIVVPKGTGYPMPDPVVRAFRTAGPTDEKIRVRIYHGEKTTSARANEFLGAADIDLHGLFAPAGTPVDVSILVDKDGCLDISASLQGDTERKSRIHIGPGEPATPPPDEERQAQGTDTKALSDLGWSIAAAKLALSRYSWALTPGRVERLEALVKEGESALEAADRDEARRAETEIDDSLASWLGLLWRLIWAENNFMGPFCEPATRRELEDLIQQISDLVRMGAAQERFAPKLARLEMIMSQEQKRLQERMAGTGKRGADISPDAL
jgi:molecular chaperone DnaK (HSP70)